jgi:hypothetical protein
MIGGNSFYVQLSPYLLLEYTYGDNTSTYLSSQVKFSRIKNNYLGGQVQLLNGSASLNVTQNVLDTSAANLGGYKWAFLDKDVPVPYINTDSNLIFNDLSSLLPSLFVTYDRVRVHIVSGYRLEDLEGLIIQVYGREAMTSNISVLANNVFLNSDDRDILNPKPILLGDRMYDRYIEMLVPSIKGINSDFYANPNNPISLGYQFTSDNLGILYNSAIYVKAYEINRTEKVNGNLFLYTSDSYEVNVNQEDMYSALSANIYESSNGDYFEYYPTYAGNFIEDFIAQLNDAGGDYVVINDIEVYEQVGLDNILTFSFSQVQSSGFDGPLDFRPIIRYASSAVTFSVDYSFRIYNKSNGFQMIRRASTTSFNPRKYGRQLDKISLAQQSYPFRVYNKVYGNAPVSFIGNDYSTSFSTIYVPVFYESRNIVVQNKTVLSSGTNPVDPSFYQAIYFGQGDARIYISDFESYFKFTVNQVDTISGAITPIDLTAGEILMAFKDAAGNMIKIPAQPSDSNSSLAQGELIFKLPDTLRKKIFTNNKNIATTAVQPFYILSLTTGSNETLIYSGTVDKIENIGKETARAKEIVTVAQTSSPESGTTTSTAMESSSASTGVVKPGKSILSTLTESNSLSIDSMKATPEVNPVVIPGYSTDEGAASMKRGIKPTSTMTDSTTQAEVNARLSQRPGTNTMLT